MNNYSRKAFALLAAVCFAAMSFTACRNETATGQSGSQTTYDGEVKIVLSDDTITIDGETAGTQNSKAVYLSNDVICYENKDSYESGNPYGEGTDSDKHTADEAAATTVVNITQAGTYRLSGSLSQGQIRVDLGEDANTDETAVVTLVLDNADITCDVAPALLFLNVYECDNEWNTDTAQSNVDTAKAGANIVIADGSENNIDGAYVAKIFKDKEGEKKLWKQDGALYSYMSMNINSEAENTGVLNINAANEGLGTELHLTVNGGNINIFSNNDGINTNEDGVSVTTINGGNIRIVAGLGAEGDGIDSNGWLVINGGTVVASANPAADAGMDSDMGSFINGGTVVALGSTMDWAESNSQQVTMNLQFAQYKESDNAIIVTKDDESVVFAYDTSEDEVVGSNMRRFMGAIISCPEFALHDSYNVYIGGTVKGSETAGIYDTASVTGFEGAVQQAYSGTDVMMRPGMGGFGGNIGGMRPDKGEFKKSEFDPNNIPEGSFNPEHTEPNVVAGERPESFDGEMTFDENSKPVMPEGMQPPEGFGGEMIFDENGKPVMPEGMQPPEGFGGEMTFDENGKPVMPEGMEPPEGFDNEMAVDENGKLTGFGDEGKFGFKNGGFSPQTGENVAGLKADNSVFFMQDKVNNFSGVADYTA